MLSIEEAINVAEEIFFDMAPDNLSSALLEKLQDPKASLFIEANEEFSDWEELLNYQPELDEFVEIDVFYNESENTKKILAKILVALDEEEKECHVLWELGEE